MNFWIPYLVGFLCCSASLGVWLSWRCIRLTVERENWRRQAYEMAALLMARNDAPMQIVWRAGIPVLTPIEVVEQPEELEVGNV